MAPTPSRTNGYMTSISRSARFLALLTKSATGALSCTLEEF
eukprot:CAMPEP_0171924720 /NCGR_PEP_ID=MMETSP0993-20121228/23241_1 /TAXON_ID=483369 /ORGANISM="non described non described, Strain CCMP2098" /LENGTH=40 /DNA_ID= /DNA_START= /DNA_END= /DNA_ORIENTATION=